MTDHVEVLRMILDGRISGRISEWPQIKPAIEYAITALSARASAGEGGEWTEKARQMIAELRDYVVNERDAQVLPRKAASYQRELDDIDALLTAAPQPAQAGASGGEAGPRARLRQHVMESVAKSGSGAVLVSAGEVAALFADYDKLAAAPQPQEAPAQGHAAGAVVACADLWHAIDQARDPSDFLARTIALLQGRGVTRPTPLAINPAEIYSKPIEAAAAIAANSEKGDGNGME